MRHLLSCWHTAVTNRGRKPRSFYSRRTQGKKHNGWFAMLLKRVYVHVLLCAQAIVCVWGSLCEVIEYYKHLQGTRGQLRTGDFLQCLSARHLCIFYAWMVGQLGDQPTWHIYGEAGCHCVPLRQLTRRLTPKKYCSTRLLVSLSVCLGAKQASLSLGQPKNARKIMSI